MRPYPVIVFLAALALGSLAACGGSTSPSGAPQVVLTLGLVQDTSEAEPFLRVEAKVSNRSNVTVHYPLPCPDDIVITLEDSGGNPVWLRDPQLDLVCLPGFQPLEPDDSATSSADLRSTWAQDGTFRSLPAGAYTARASFTYHWDEFEASEQVEKHLNFVTE